MKNYMGILDWNVHDRASYHDWLRILGLHETNKIYYESHSVLFHEAHTKLSNGYKGVITPPLPPRPKETK